MTSLCVRRSPCPLRSQKPLKICFYFERHFLVLDLDSVDCSLHCSVVLDSVSVDCSVVLDSVDCSVTDTVTVKGKINTNMIDKLLLCIVC